MRLEEFLETFDRRVEHIRQFNIPESIEIYFRCMRDYYQSVLDARRDGKPLAWISIMAPMEIFRAMDIVPFAVENALKLSRAARAAGVQRVVHVRITNPGGDSPLGYLRVKARLDGLTAGSLYTDSSPAGKTRLTDWAKQNPAGLGVRYAGELARSKARIKSYGQLQRSFASNRPDGKTTGKPPIAPPS